MFALAEALHMTVVRMEAEMTVWEFNHWIAHFKIREDERPR